VVVFAGLPPSPDATNTGVVDELLRRIREHAQGWALAPAWVGLVDPGGSTDTGTVTLAVLRPGRVDAADPRWPAQVAELNERVSRWTGSTIVCHEIEEGDIEVPADVEGGSTLTAYGRPSAPLRSHARPADQAQGRPSTIEPTGLQAVPCADMPGS
jgi:hypothetical protein